MQPVRTQRAVDITADRLRHEILRGHWAPGQLLPPERQLAAELEVNRLTLRAALSRLEAEYLIAPHQGRGILVLDWRRQGGLGLMVHLPDAEGGEEMRELLALRRALAAEAVALACIHAEPEHLDVLNQLMQRQRHEEDPLAFFEGELRFTRALVEAAGSLPLQLLFNSMERIFRTHPGPIRAMLRDRPAARASYAALLALVRSGRSDLARRAVLQVLTEEDQAALAELLTPR